MSGETYRNRRVIISEFLRSNLLVIEKLQKRKKFRSLRDKNFIDVLVPARQQWFRVAYPRNYIVGESY